MGETNRSGNTKLYNLKIDKETDLPLFHKVEKDDNDKWVEARTVTGLEGYLRGITTEKYTYEGQEKMSIKILLKDNDSDAMIQIKTSMNNAVRSMLNSLAGCLEFGLIHLQGSKWGKGEKKYPTIFVENEGQKTQWKYQIDEIPKVEQISDGVYDDRDANAFFKNVIAIDINAKLGDTSAPPPSRNSAKTELIKQESTYVPDPPLPPYVDDLPF